MGNFTWAAFQNTEVAQNWNPLKDRKSEPWRDLGMDLLDKVMVQFDSQGGEFPWTYMAGDRLGLMVDENESDAIC